MRRLLVSGLAVGAVTLVVGLHHSVASSFNPDPVFPIGPISDTTSHQIAKLDQVASKLAGHQEIVNCWSEKAWELFNAWEAARHNYRLVNRTGVTWFTSRRIELSPNICQILAQALARSANQPLFTAVALTTLAHESAHASGIHAENRAECRGIETEPEAAARLGIPRAIGKRLQHIYRGTAYLSGTPEYTTPPCPSGLPGLLVPDTLGTVPDVRPLRRIATAVATSLRGWKNLDGEEVAIGLSPCALLTSWKFVQARFSESFSGPNHESVDFFSHRLKTHEEFATAVRRYRNLERCEIPFRNHRMREENQPGVYASGPVPAALTRISPRVHVFRLVLTNGRQKSDWDRFDIFDPADQSHVDIRFTVPVGTPMAQEVRTVKAALHFLPADG